MTTLTREEYEAKVQRRYDRYIAAAEKAETEGTAARARSDAISNMIPMGQPILVGHHSEKRHRKDIERIHNGMRRGYDLHQKAEEYRSRAASIEANDAIYSDNPDAVELIGGKLKEMKDLQALYKKINATHKKFKKDPASLDDSDLSDKFKEMIRNYVPDYSWNPHPIAGYTLTNLSANIRRMEKREVIVEKKQAMQDEDIQIGDIKIEGRPGENRIRIYFPGRVPLEMYQQLKRHGFRVKRSEGEGVFSAFYNNNALYFIKTYLKKESQ